MNSRRTLPGIRCQSCLSPVCPSVCRCDPLQSVLVKPVVLIVALASCAHAVGIPMTLVSDPEAEALQKAIDDNSPAAQIKAALTRYEASQKAKQAKLEQAQAGLRKVLTVKQEAQATLLGLLQ